MKGELVQHSSRSSPRGQNLVIGGLFSITLLWNSAYGFLAFILGLLFLGLMTSSKFLSQRTQVSLVSILLVATITASQIVNFETELDLTPFAFLILTFAFSMLSVRNLQRAHLLLLTSLVITAVSAISMVAGFTQPELATMASITGESLLKGIFPHRNLLGLFSGVSVVVLFSGIGLAKSRSQKSLFSVGILINLAALFWARSMTSLGAVALAVLLVILARWFAAGVSFGKFQRILAGLTTISLGALAIFLTTSGYSITGLVSRDETLTGRTQIWQLWFDHFNVLGFMGSGWSYSWTASDRFSTLIVQQFGFPVAHAHNLVLDSYTRSGFIAAAAVIALGLGGLINTLKNIKKFPESAQYVLLASQTYILVAGISESLLYLPAMFFIFLVSFGFHTKDKVQSASP